MLSPEQLARIKANIERLEKARDGGAHTGIRKLNNLLNGAFPLQAATPSSFATSATRS